MKPDCDGILCFQFLFCRGHGVKEAEVKQIQTAWTFYFFFWGRLVILSKTQCSVFVQFKHWTLMSKILKNTFGQPTVFWVVWTIVVWKLLLQPFFMKSFCFSKSDLGDENTKGDVVAGVKLVSYATVWHFVMIRM